MSHALSLPEQWGRTNMCAQGAEKSVSEGRDGPVSLLCSRNARSQKTLVGRAQWETHPGHPGATYTSKLGMTIVVRSLRPC